MTTPDPNHKKWAMQWKAAGPALQKIRDEELKKLDEKRLLELADEDPWQNGLVLFQRWMIRKAILDAYGREPPSDG